VNIINTVDKNLIDQKQINKEIKLHEYIHTLKKCKSNSPGPDFIPYSYIQNVSIKTLDFLLKMYNRIWKEGTWPKKWKIGIIITIPKPEKNRFKPEGYRLITLLNIMCKLFEKNTKLQTLMVPRKNKFLLPKTKWVQEK